MKGRKPKPLQQQIVEGDPAKRGVHQLEKKLDAQPKATPGLPSCPRHLRGRARYAWGFWSAELQTMKLDKRPDAMKLEGACVAYAKAVEADLILEREGLTVKEQFIADDGEVVVLKIKKHPANEISKQNWLLVRSFGSDFGFDPVSRVRLTIEKPEPGVGDDLLAMLGQQRDRRSPEITVN